MWSIMNFRMFIKAKRGAEENVYQLNFAILFNILSFNLFSSSKIIALMLSITSRFTDAPAASQTNATRF